MSNIKLSKSKHVLVVVLGPIEQSPRMQNHVTSLLDTNHKVTLIACDSDAKKSSLIGVLNNRIGHENDHSSLNIELITQLPQVDKFPNFLNLIIKTIWLAVNLLYLLLFNLQSKPDVILTQNPPSIPTFPIIWLYCKIFNARFIIDWHNYGFSIFSLKYGDRNIGVMFMKQMEIFFGSRADAGFCVTEAMKKDLKKNLKIRYPLIVLYDKPPRRFKPLTKDEKHEFLIKMNLYLSKMNDESKPAILFSSTSWTPDEDFDVLLEALHIYENAVKIDGGIHLPKLICVITGKGPLKPDFESKFKSSGFKHIDIRLMWLSIEDYTKMVASCDIGLSLHKSSSGVDLPMKVVDMFGCGIPALSFKYQAINELILEGKFGRTFTNSAQLARLLEELLRDFNRADNTECDLKIYSDNIKKQYLSESWERNWLDNAFEVISSNCHIDNDKKK